MSLCEQLCTITGQPAENNYNLFFNPNICHVCKTPNKDNLIPCDQCYMIFYCCQKHKNMHFELHLPVCTSIAKVIAVDSEWNTTRFNNLEDWKESQKELMRIIQLDIGRNLQLYEVEMFMCAKSCLICYQQINLQTCHVCYSANYCNDHISEFIPQHMSCCKELLLFLNINIKIINPICNLYPENQLYEFINEKLFDDMTAFVDEYIAAKYLNSQRTRSKFSWKVEHYIYSEYMSDPLTLYYALKKLNLLRLPRTNYKYVIHIITTSVVDMRDLKAWELLLHLFSNIKELYLIMIKPTVEFVTDPHNLCTQCCTRGQKFYVQNVSMPYHEYVSMESYIQPNVIIGFHAKINVGETWSESLTTIMAQNCPLVLTAKFQNKTNENLKTKQIVGTTRKLLSIQNKFRSCKPCRDYKTGGIFYRNAYVTMFL